ncbi:hypothetical protein [Actinomyces sp. 432]|uniref:hypothetical protein n=1 Tax=Actinomyces sp. 432 TaxID=2057798 RepID=UPI001F2A09D4|nr:hypothetical protein [Actinomyces sp. 432]
MPNAAWRRACHGLRDGLGSARAIIKDWWRARTTGFRTAVRTITLLVLTGLMSLAIGVSTACASSPLGPHEATWSVTLDSTLGVDLGPLGSVTMDSPAGPSGWR